MILFKNLNNFLCRDVNGVPPGGVVNPPAGNTPPAGSEPPAGTEAPAGEHVQLSRKEYADLMAERALMQAQIQQQQTPPAAASIPTPDKPLEQMNGKELRDFLEANSLKPLAETVMQIAVQQELQNVQAKYGDDFIKGKDEIYNICQANPHLTLEQGYLLYKGMEGLKTPPKPANSTPPPPPGERPGAPPATTEPKKEMSATEAATQALKELNIQF